MVSIPLVEGRTGGSAGAPPPGVATSRKVRARAAVAHRPCSAVSHPLPHLRR